MKVAKNTNSIHLNLLNGKTNFEKIEEDLKISIFGVLFVLLKNKDFNIYFEIFVILLQFLQFTSFAFYKVVKIIKLFHLVRFYMETRYFFFRNFKFSSIF